MCVKHRAKITFIVPFILIPAIFFKIIAVAALLSWSFSAAEARRMRIDLAEEARGTVSEAKLIHDLSFLADSVCAGRATGSAGSIEAATWIARRFAKLGLKPIGQGYTHNFKVSSTLVGRNVIGLLKGNDSARSKGYIIIAAAYDGLGIIAGKRYPGADSNASGVVAMLSMAGMMSISRDLGRSYGTDVIFVALDAKYQRLAGSAALWDEICSRSLTDPSTGKAISRGDIKVMVNIDQIGSTLSPVRPGRNDYMLMLSGGYGIKEMEQGNKSKGTGLDLSYTYYGSRDFTNAFYNKIGDHRIFVENRIPAVLFTSGITMNNNKTTDTVESLDAGILKRRIYLMWNWLERIAVVREDKMI